MAPIEENRAQPGISQKSRKRQRVGFEKANPLSRKELSSNAVSLDTLLWNKVSFPEQFEDAEGFFGLEEISDVDVARDPKVGKVEYRLSSSTANRSGPREDKYEIEDDNLERDYRSPNVDDEEWTGFEDPGIETPRHGSIPNPNPLLNNSLSKVEAKRQKRQIKTNKKQEDERADAQTTANTFEALNGTEDGEGDVSAWESLNLSSSTMSSLARLKLASPTPIQSSAIPEILGGHDVIGKASTGSGKTLAFGIPIYEHYLKTRDTQPHHSRKDEGRERLPPLALILSPTRELAHQLSTHLNNLCSVTSSLSIATLTGGLSVHKQKRLLANADIVIGTPGRLWEFIHEDSELSNQLKSIRFLVLDEADRLLSEGHFKEVEEIVNLLDKTDEDQDEGRENAIAKGRRQTLVFSATFQKDLQRKLAGKSKSSSNEIMSKNESMDYLLQKLNFREEKPKFIDVNPIHQMASGLKEGIVECAGLDKDLYLYTLLLSHPKPRTLIFTNSIPTVRRLTPFLQNLALPAHALHSQMPQKSRLRTLERFSSPSPNITSILIATDVAARGLDIPAVDLVIHYHLPRAADTYIHRSGRTARAGNAGASILLCAPAELQGMNRLVAKIHARDTASNKTSYMRTVDLSTRLLSRLKARVVLAKKIADSALAKEKKGHEENWMRDAAEELGVVYNSEEFSGGKGRGAGRVKRERESRGVSKAELQGLRRELGGLLGERVNVGGSERYLTAGGGDVEGLMEGGGEVGGIFSGRSDVGGLW